MNKRQLKLSEQPFTVRELAAEIEREKSNLLENEISCVHNRKFEFEFENVTAVVTLSLKWDVNYIKRTTENEILTIEDAFVTTKEGIKTPININNLQSLLN